MRQPQKCCALTDIMVNQAVEIHEQDSLFASRSKIASDDHNVSLIKLDVEEVSAKAMDVAKLCERNHVDVIRICY